MCRCSPLFHAKALLISVEEKTTRHCLWFWDNSCGLTDHNMPLASKAQCPSHWQMSEGAQKQLKVWGGIKLTYPQIAGERTALHCFTHLNMADISAVAPLHCVGISCLLLTVVSRSPAGCCAEPLSSAPGRAGPPRPSQEVWDIVEPRWLIDKRVHSPDSL